MSYSVCISINRSEVLLDAFDWLEEQELVAIHDYRYTKPDYFKDDWNFTFTFNKESDATLFALRWS